MQQTVQVINVKGRHEEFTFQGHVEQAKQIYERINSVSGQQVVNKIVLQFQVSSDPVLRHVQKAANLDDFEVKKVKFNPKKKAEVVVIEEEVKQIKPLEQCNKILEQSRRPQKVQTHEQELLKPQKQPETKINAANAVPQSKSNGQLFNKKERNQALQALGLDSNKIKQEFDEKVVMKTKKREQKEELKLEQDNKTFELNNTMVIKEQKTGQSGGLFQNQENSKLIEQIRNRHCAFDDYKTIYQECIVPLNSQFGKNVYCSRWKKGSKYFTIGCRCTNCPFSIWFTYEISESGQPKNIKWKRNCNVSHHISAHENEKLSEPQTDLAPLIQE